MKFPQIYQIWRNRSVLGLNIHSLYFECAENLPFVVYNLVQVLGRVRQCNLQGYPFSTFGESVMILIQAIIQVLLFHQQCWCKGAMYSFTTDVNVNGKLLFRNFSLLFLSALLIMFIPPKVRLFSLLLHQFQILVPIISTLFGLFARIPQIITNFKQGHTGQLSLISWSFSLVGSAVRIFTTLMEVPDKLILCMYISGFVCNLILVLQILLQGWESVCERQVLGENKDCHSKKVKCLLKSLLLRVECRSCKADIQPCIESSTDRCTGNERLWIRGGNNLVKYVPCPHCRVRTLSVAANELKQMGQSSCLTLEKEVEGNMRSS